MSPYVVLPIIYILMSPLIHEEGEVNKKKDIRPIYRYIFFFISSHKLVSKRNIHWKSNFVQGLLRKTFLNLIFSLYNRKGKETLLIKSALFIS